jgi:hypothetical protein
MDSNHSSENNPDSTMVIQGGFNNCYVAGSMSEEDRYRAMGKYYDSQPMTKDKEEWYSRFSSVGDDSNDNGKPKRKKAVSKKKKPNPQPKINKVFEQKKNRDGYLMRHCKFQPEVGDFVYVPPKYGDISAKKKLSCDFCCHCQLSPCLTQEFLGETHDKAIRLELYGDKEPTEIRQIISEDLQRKHCKLFKRRYNRRTKSQRCIEKYVNSWFADDGIDTDDESQPELFFDILQNRQIGDGPEWG